jgi:hypothetical protein
MVADELKRLDLRWMQRGLGQNNSAVGRLGERGPAFAINNGVRKPANS